MKVTFLFKKGMIGDIRRYLLKRRIKRQIAKMTRVGSHRMLALGLGVVATAVAVGAGAWIFGKTTGRRLA